MLSNTEIVVRYNETDQMGVVYHANYLVWLEMGRTKFLADIGFNYADIEKHGLLFPVREINIEYLIPCRYGETVFVETSVKDFSSVKTVYQHTIKNTNNEIKAKAISTVVCVSKDTFKLTRIEKVLPDVYQAYKNLKN
ncbi:MAG: fcbC [Haloplasmataceae bacterium]|jgi:acyl-CoA thioester hydrolase|nr:fcbC [Haloplasmataceae bacterium]